MNRRWWKNEGLQGEGRGKRIEGEERGNSIELGGGGIIEQGEVQSGLNCSKIVLINYNNINKLKILLAQSRREKKKQQQPPVSLHHGKVIYSNIFMYRVTQRMGLNPKPPH